MWTSEFKYSIFPDRAAQALVVFDCCETDQNQKWLDMNWPQGRHTKGQKRVSSCSWVRKGTQQKHAKQTRLKSIYIISSGGWVKQSSILFSSALSGQNHLFALCFQANCPPNEAAGVINALSSHASTGIKYVHVVYWYQIWVFCDVPRLVSNLRVLWYYHADCVPLLRN